MNLPLIATLYVDDMLSEDERAAVELLLDENPELVSLVDELQRQIEVESRLLEEDHLLLHNSLLHEAEPQLTGSDIISQMSEIGRYTYQVNDANSRDRDDLLVSDPASAPLPSKRDPRRLLTWAVLVASISGVVLVGVTYLFPTEDRANLNRRIHPDRSDVVVKEENRSRPEQASGSPIDSSVRESPNSSSIARNSPGAQPAVLVSTQPITLFVPEDTGDSFGLGSAEVPDDTLTARLYQVYGPAEYSFQGNLLSLYLPKRLMSQPLKLRLSQRPDSTYRLRVNQTSFQILRGKRQLLR